MCSRLFCLPVVVGVLAGVLTFSGNCWAQGSDPLPIMPLPSSAVRGQGEFLIDGTFNVAFDGYKEPRLQRARSRFLDVLSRQTGIAFGIEQAHEKPSLLIKTDGSSAALQVLGENESYRLEIAADAIHLSAANPLGVMHGLQTLLQLVTITPRGFAVPVVTIEDKPRFPWRGLMIDSGRHFMPIPSIERNLDGMEAVKLNVFHWHLSDDQGFRIESKVFPLLQEKGSDGLYYTQDQIRGVIAYARDRGIRVIPEFDMPAHASSWFPGYPELASGKGPYAMERSWGVLDGAMDPTKESTYTFLNKFIGEMTGLFPDVYFHIGGDECNGKAWDASPRIQEFKVAHQLRDNAALQAYFTARIQKLVASRHKVMEGWDEVLQPDTPKDVVIQSWRGRDSLVDAAKRGYRVVLSNGYYIDLNQPAAEHYLVDPMPGPEEKLTPEQSANILGGEATMWSEFVSAETMDSRIWPRTAAIAERYWSPQEVRDVDSMYQRMAIVSNQLAYHGLYYVANSKQMMQRMVGDSDVDTLRVLASVVEPAKGYERGETGNYTSYTPFNHMVDAVPPESDTAREFNAICKQVVAGTATPEEWQQAHDWLVLWRDNDAKLQPTLAKSSLTAELVPVSLSLNQIAEAGLRALASLHDGKALAAATKQQDTDFLKSAEKAQGMLLVGVGMGVETLVNGAKVE